jgi:hypothetical protein
MEAVAALKWPDIAQAFDDDGYAILPPLLNAEDRAALVGLEPDDQRFRTRIDMARHRFGIGRYGYFANPIPPAVAALRQALCVHLALIASDMMEKLGREPRYPAMLDPFLERCAQAGQTKPTPLLLRYEAGGHNRLHQDLYGDLSFPIQATMMLSDPTKDFTGGEFLVAETAPRQQTRAEAIVLQAGETILFPTMERPIVGARGRLRARMRHGVSRIRSGERFTLGLIFHNAG